MTDEAQDYEGAMVVCGFGLFNVCLLLVAIPTIASTSFETSSMSYVLATAECDLHLTLFHKGLLNAITYAGTILTAIPWGYIADTYGRKSVLVCGLLIDTVVVLCAAISQNITFLMVFKFLGGASVCGPYAVIMSYISEFHGKKHRSIVLLFAGMMHVFGLLILAVLATFILPQHIWFSFAGFEFHTWNAFVAVTAIPSCIAGTFLIFFPESPKFLMTQGRNDDALHAFQIIYSMNNRKTKDSFPVKRLIEEDPEKSAKYARRSSIDRTFSQKKADAKETFIDGLKQLKPMFTRPYLGRSILVYVMGFCVVLSQNTIRLWLPQIFASYTEYENKGTGNVGVCTILEYSVNKTHAVRSTADTERCDTHVAAESFINNIIVAGVGCSGFLVAGIIVNKIGNNNLLIGCLSLAFLSGSAFYFTFSKVSTIVIAALFITVGSISSTTIISVSVNIFPTAMRTMVVIMVMTFGRLGCVLGNILFPILISLGCEPPFIIISGITLLALVIALFLPNANKISLK